MPVWRTGRSANGILQPTPTAGAAQAATVAASANPVADGVYAAALPVSMTGTWRVIVQARRPSGAAASVACLLTIAAPG